MEAKTLKIWTLQLHLMLIRNISLYSEKNICEPHDRCMYILCFPHFHIINPSVFRPQFSLSVFLPWCYLFKTHPFQRLAMRREMTRINLTCYDGVRINSHTSLLKLWNWASLDLGADIAADCWRVRWLHKVFQALHDGLFSISSAALRPCFSVCWPKRKAHKGQGCLSTFPQL